MSGIVASLRDVNFREFGHFLWSGSFDPRLEEKLDGVNGKHVNVRDITETSFKHDDYTFRDAKDLIPRLDEQPIGKNHNNNGSPYTGEVHQQVTLTCPNIEYYKNKYKQFHDCARLGQHGVVVVALIIQVAFVAFSMIKKTSIAALSSWSISLLAVGLIGGGAFWSRANRAGAFFRSVSIDPFDFGNYAQEIQSAREKLFGVNLRHNTEIKDETVASPREREIVELLKVRKSLEEILRKSLPVSPFLDSDDLKKLKESAPTLEETQVIKTYLLDLDTLRSDVSDWVRTTTEYLKEIPDKKDPNYGSCERHLNEISTKFSTATCWDQLYRNEALSVIRDLEQYLDKRFKGDEKAALLPKKELAGLIQDAKDKAKKEIQSILNGHFFCHITDNSTHPFWARAGLNRNFTWRAEPKSE